MRRTTYESALVFTRFFAFLGVAFCKDASSETAQIFDATHVCEDYISYSHLFQYGQRHTGPTCEKTPETQTDLTFYQIYTTPFMSPRNHRSLESILFHYPHGNVRIYSAVMPKERIGKYIQRGFDVKIVNYSLNHLLHRLVEVEPKTFLPHAEPFLEQIPSLAHGQYWYVQETDIVRLILLYLYGGVYLDTDMILFRSLDSLENVIAWENYEETRLNNAVLKFQPRNRFIGKCIEEFLRHYDPINYAANGPELFTRVAERFPHLICGHNVKRTARRGPCAVNCLRRESFYPFTWEDSPKCFEVLEPLELQNLRQTIDELSFAVHLFNRTTQRFGTSREGTLCRYVLNKFCVFCDEMV